MKATSAGAKDDDDNAGALAYKRTRSEEAVPIEVADRLLAGDNPVKVWREYRGLTLTGLADRAGVGRGYLSQIERGECSGGPATLRKLAAALAIDIEDLSPVGRPTRARNRD